MARKPTQNYIDGLQAEVTALQLAISCHRRRGNASRILERELHQTRSTLAAARSLKARREDSRV